MISFNTKMVVSGQFVELYEFQTRIYRGIEKTKEDLTKVKEHVERVFSDNAERREDNIIRTRQNIRRLINSNTDLNKFLTLTFADNVQCVDTANYEFKKFIIRLKYQYPELKYLTVIEFQKRGAVHYHMVCNMPYVSKDLLQDIWGKGFIKINRIQHCDNVGAYVSKYLSKETSARLFNKKKYFCSRDLIRPIEVVDKSIIDKLIEMYKIKDIPARCEKVFHNEHVGLIRYYQFKINVQTN